MVGQETETAVVVGFMQYPHSPDLRRTVAGHSGSLRVLIPRSTGVGGVLWFF